MMRRVAATLSSLPSGATRRDGGLENTALLGTMKGSGSGLTSSPRGRWRRLGFSSASSSLPSRGLRRAKPEESWLPMLGRSSPSAAVGMAASSGTKLRGQTGRGQGGGVGGCFTILAASVSWPTPPWTSASALGCACAEEGLGRTDGRGENLGRWVDAAALGLGCLATYPASSAICCAADGCVGIGRHTWPGP